MKKTILVICLTILVGAACAKKAEETAVMDNPFFSEFATPFGVPPFDLIKPEHYMPAFERGMAEQKKEIAAITSNPEPPTFANTVEALDRSGALLNKVAGVFNNMTSSNTNEELQKIDKALAPKLAQHGDDIAMDAALFARVKARETSSA
jgi:peptidyl-dipeptidase Dcp